MDCISAVQGHTRSLILVPIERAYATSYLWLIVILSYLAQFLRYGELLAENCELFLPNSHLTPSLGVNPFEFLNEFFIPKTRVIGLSVRDPSLRRFHSVPACDGQTDRRTDRQTDIVANTGLCVASYADLL